IPIPAPGERTAVDAHPGETLRLACGFGEVKGGEAGSTLDLTFPNGGVVAVEQFNQWAAAQGATITDCNGNKMTLADFIVAWGMRPEDVLPAAGPQGGPQGATNHPTFAVTPSTDLLGGYPHPNILPGTALSYSVPTPTLGFLPVEGGLGARDD